MARWNPRNDDTPNFPPSALSCPHNKRTCAATRIQATYRGGQTRNRVVRTALAEFRDICDRISNECSDSAAAAALGTLTFRRPTDLPRCFGADALVASAPSAMNTASASPTSTATASVTATATTASATATSATAAAATTTATILTAEVSPMDLPREGGDDNLATAAANNNNNNDNKYSGLRQLVSPLLASSMLRDPLPQAESARDARRAYHGRNDRGETDGGSTEKCSVGVVVAVKDNEEEKQEEQKQEEKRAEYCSQHDGGFGHGGGSGGREGHGGEGGGGGGGECLFAYSDDSEEDDEEGDDSLATGGDGATGLRPTPLFLSSAASNTAGRSVPATIAAPGHHHHGRGGGNDGKGEEEEEQQRQQEIIAGMDGAVRGDDGSREDGPASTPTIASSDRERERLSCGEGGGMPGISTVSGVSGLSSRRASSSPPPVTAEGSPSNGGDRYRDEALAVVKKGLVDGVDGERVPETQKVTDKPEAPKPLSDDGDGQDKNERGGEGRVASVVERATAAAAAVAVPSLSSSFSLGSEAVANKSDHLPLRLVSDTTTATATAAAIPAAAVAAAAAATTAYGIPSPVLNDGDIYVGDGLWGSRDGLRTGLSSSFASSCETTPLKGEAISAAAVAAAAATASPATHTPASAFLEHDGRDAAGGVITTTGAAEGGYWRTPGVYEVSHECHSGGGRRKGEDAVGITRDLTKNWGPLSRDDEGGRASEGCREPPASTVAVAVSVEKKYVDRGGSTRIADASSLELEEELRSIRETLANRVRYLQQFWKREEQLGGAAERDPCDVARRLLERR